MGKQVRVQHRELAHTEHCTQIIITLGTAAGTRGTLHEDKQHTWNRGTHINTQRISTHGTSAHSEHCTLRINDHMEHTKFRNIICARIELVITEQLYTQIFSNIRFLIRNTRTYTARIFNN